MPAYAKPSIHDEAEHLGRDLVLRSTCHVVFLSRERWWPVLTSDGHREGHLLAIDPRLRVERI